MVERGEAKLVTTVQIVELDVVLAAGHKLARQHDAPFAVVPGDVGRNVAADPGRWWDQDRSHFVARLEFAVVEGDLVLLFQVIGATLVRRRAAPVHELGLAVDQLDVVVAAAGFRIALAPSLGSFVFVVAGVVEVLIIGLTNIAGADRLHMPDVAELALVRQVLIAKRFTRLAGMAGGHAALLAEVLDRVADVPDQRNLVFIVDVVISTFVLRVAQFLPAAVGLLLIRKAADRLCRIVVLHEHVEHVAGINRLDVAVVLPSLKFAPPARATVTPLAWAHAGSAAPAARSGALATLTAMMGSAADASNKKPDMATMATGNNARLLAIHMLLGPPS